MFSWYGIHVLSHTSTVRKNAIADERVRYCALCTHSVAWPLRCANLFYFSLGNFIFNLSCPAIFITQLAHSCFPFSFAVEALSAKVMYRTGRSAARPTATETPHCGRRPECDCRWPGPGTGRRWAEPSLSAQQPMGIERAVAVHQG